MGINLFDASDDDNEEISKIQTNEEFARRYEHNKKREELQRLEELKKKGLVKDSDDSSVESEEENDEDVVGSGKRDLEFLDALVKVKKKDPIINKEDAKLFESESEEDESEENGEKATSVKEKPMYLKDVVAKHLIEEGPELKEKGSKSGLMSYTEEQEVLRQEFLNAAKEAFNGDEGDLLMEKTKNEGYEDKGENDNDAIESRLDEYFGGDDNLDENEMFLKNYFRNKMWIENDKEKKPFTEDLLGISEDEEEVEKQEKYEVGYNFRFEEGPGDRVVGHSRFTEGSVRKKNNARKLQRKSKEERMAQAEFERKEELKHLKNLKRKEIGEKLEKIRTIAGISGEGACTLNEDDLEDDFDPEVYNQKMKEMFDMDYYEAQDADPGFHSDSDEDGDYLKKPDFEKEDELLGLGKDWDAYGSGDGFSALREKIKQKAGNEDVELSDEGEGGQVNVPEEGKRKRKRKIPLREKVALDKELEEYYKLDYEDTIGDLKTRFRYTSVPSQRYGLNAAEIIMMDDKELSQYVSLKKLAPYREKEWKVPKIKRYNLKIKNKQVAPGENFKNRDTEKKKSLKGPSHSASLEADALEQGKNHEKELNGEIGEVSKQSRKRRRQAELKLSQSRLMAYGKISTKSKKKKKH